MAPGRPTVLFIDHDDSFTYNLVHLLTEAGASVVVRRATEVDVHSTRCERAILGPGHGRPEQAAQLLARFTAAHPTLPVLGVCLGHQAVARWEGGAVVRSRHPTHGERVAIEHGGDGLFRGIPSPLFAARYNSLSVDEGSVPLHLEVTATTATGEIMALRHRTRPIQGIQFHPESVVSDFGRQILSNWLEDM
jgi:anthranilate synthase component 2